MNPVIDANWKLHQQTRSPGTPCRREASALSRSQHNSHPTPSIHANRQRKPNVFRSAMKMIYRYRPPRPAIQTIVLIVTQHKYFARAHQSLSKIAEIRAVWMKPMQIWLRNRLPIAIEHGMPRFQPIPRYANHPLNVLDPCHVRSFEDDDVPVRWLMKAIPPGVD